MSDLVTLFEVGPRDGLQNEKNLVSTADKVRLINLLSTSGLTKIEATSFVSPKWVPQMADAADVMSTINRSPDICYSALTPNMRGFQDALKANVNEVAVFASASEGFSQRNINCSIDDSLQRYQSVVDAAREHSIPVRGYISCVTDCPYEGAVSPVQVASISKKLLNMGCYEISLGDTIGAANPDSVQQLLLVLSDVAPARQFAGHFHDTKGHALENIVVCLENGIRVFDAAVGGLGGCPYAPGASGNVATEAVVKLLLEKGIETSIHLEKIEEAAIFARTLRQ